MLRFFSKFGRQHFNHQNKQGFQKKIQHAYDNTKLEVRKIPREMNTITQLNEHFSKFGTIVNIQVRELEEDNSWIFHV